MTKKSKKNFFTNLKNKLLNREDSDESEFENFEEEIDSDEELSTPLKSKRNEESVDIEDEEFEDFEEEEDDDEVKEEISDENNYDEEDDSDDWAKEEDTEELEEILASREEEAPQETIEADQEDIEASEFQTMSRPSPDETEAEKADFSFSNSQQNAKEKVSQLKDTIADLNWENLVVDLFSPPHRPTFHKIFLISLIGGSSLLMGKLVAQKLTSLLKPSKTLSRSKPPKRSLSLINLKPIDKYNIFNSEDLEKVTKGSKFVKKKKVRKITKCDKSGKKSALPIKLLNTIVLQDSSKSLASISVKGNKKLQDIREGEKIGSIAKVGKITRLRMIFKNLKSERCEYVDNSDKKFESKYKKKKFTILDPKAGKKLMKKKEYAGVQNKGNKYKIKQSLKNEMLSDISNVLGQARAIQIKNPDGSLAFKITEVEPGSIYSKLNINDGDIISKIDGKPIENLNDIMSLFGRIKDVQNLSLTLKRNGEEETQEYSFDK